ncbi:MAG: hypothetical protein WDO13_19560 [Verrucomicrobiota bacterium]
MKTTSILVPMVMTLVLAASPLAWAQTATHPSENYPGKGGSADSTNTTSSPTSPEQQNPSSGMQNPPTQANPNQANKGR